MLSYQKNNHTFVLSLCSEEEEKEISTEAKDEAPIPPARTKKSESLTSTEPKIEVKQSTTAVETAEEVPKTPILHQPSVQPEPPSGIMGYIRSFFSCMASKKWIKKKEREKFVLLWNIMFEFRKKIFRLTDGNSLKKKYIP